MNVEDRVKLGFGIYIHWPYCQAKCPYCDFNSHVSAQIDEARWKAAYLSELERAHAETPDRILTSVFFGGGTPSLMSADLVQAIIAKIKSLWRTTNSLEITLEANPTSSEADKFLAFSQAGVNRLSMGIQALNNADLKKLGRLHSVDEAKRAFNFARDAFDRVSFDLIYARQNQTASQWEAELREATEMAVDHLSLYQLTIEPGTAFGARFDAGKLLGLPADDLSADMYNITQAITTDAGMAAYETSNHARLDCESAHNLIYWRGGDYVGIGPGAHGRLTLPTGRFATTTPLDPIAWLRAVEVHGQGEAPREVISSNEQLVEYVMMSLRLSEGLDLNFIQHFEGANNLLSKISDMEAQGYLVVKGHRVSVCDEYKILLNAVLRDLLI